MTSDQTSGSEPQMGDMTEGKWESLPADSETQVDYPRQVVEQFELPAGELAGFSPDLVVTMTVTFPDGSLWEHSERIPQDPGIDVVAQADAMVEAVSESMAARLKRAVL